MSEVLTPDQITSYDKNGYVVLEATIDSTSLPLNAQLDPNAE